MPAVVNKTPGTWGVTTRGRCVWTRLRRRNALRTSQGLQSIPVCGTVSPVLHPRSNAGNVLCLDLCPEFFTSAFQQDKCARDIYFWFLHIQPSGLFVAIPVVFQMAQRSNSLLFLPFFNLKIHSSILLVTLEVQSLLTLPKVGFTHSAQTVKPGLPLGPIFHAFSNFPVCSYTPWFRNTFVSVRGSLMRRRGCACQRVAAGLALLFSRLALAEVRRR